MKPAVFHVEAEQKLDDAVRFYDRQRPGLGREFHDLVEEAVSRARRMPRVQARFRDTNYRKSFVDRFPYTVFFLELDDRIFIAAVAHQKRREGYWLSRSPDD